MVSLERDPFPPVLVVDDDAMNIAVINSLLQQESVCIDSAMEGKQGIKLVRERIAAVLFKQTDMYKLILIDFSMPDMNGPDLAKLIVGMINDTGLSLPYIGCVTSYMEESFRQQVLAAGMQEMITKPITSEKMG